MKTKRVAAALLFGFVVLPPLFYLRTHDSLRKFEGLRPGAVVPMSKLQTMDGQWIETRSWLGTPTLLLVFNPECRSCQQEILNLASITHRFPKLKVVLLSTKFDISSMQAPFPVHVDRSGAFLTQVQRLATPALYWIDASGTVRYTRIGERGAAEEDRLFRRLEALGK